MLEHLFFRGSERYPDSVRMNAAVEAVGGNLNGATMRDSSSYYTSAHPDGIGVALRILGDMLTRPRLVHLDTEKRVILEEMLDEVDERGRDIDVDNLTKHIEEQIQTAIDSAAVILFVVDTRAGLMPLDEEVGRRLRDVEVPVLCIPNKTDDEKRDVQTSEC